MCTDGSEIMTRTYLHIPWIDQSVNICETGIQISCCFKGLKNTFMYSYFDLTCALMQLRFEGREGHYVRLHIYGRVCCECFHAERLRGIVSPFHSLTCNGFVTNRRFVLLLFVFTRKRRRNPGCPGRPEHPFSFFLLDI